MTVMQVQLATQLYVLAELEEFRQLQVKLDLRLGLLTWLPPAGTVPGTCR